MGLIPPMVHVMEMACVSQRTVNDWRTALQIVGVEITTVNINLERRLTTVHRTVGSVEMANAIHLKVVLPVSATVAHV